MTAYERSGAPIGAARTFAALHYRNYKLWFAGQLTSVIGTWMQIIAQGWLVYEISHSEFMLGLVGFAAAIPILIVSPWGGVVTDNMSKRTLLVITQTSSMLLAFILSLLVFTNRVQVWHIIVLAALLGVVNAFDAPARQSFVVDMVDREHLGNAIALNSIIFNGARVVGPAVGGLILAALGSAWCFFLNGISFLAVIAGLLAMRLPARETQRSASRPWRQFMEGMQYARDHREIVGLLVLAAIFSVFGISYSTILPAFTDQVLHTGASGYAAVNALIGMGAMLAALYMARYSNSGHRGRILLVAGLAYPFFLTWFGFNSYFPAALALAFCLGVGFMLQLTAVNTLLQVWVSDEMRGRVMSLYTLSFFGLSPFGNLAIGAAASRLPMGITLAIGAGITLLLTLGVHILVPMAKELK
jgi:MFS family permease